MKVYKTNSYNNFKGSESTNYMLVMDDKERSHLYNIFFELLQKLSKSDGTPKRWNKFDDDALTFIHRMCFYHQNGEMMDPTIGQLELLVNKMLKKVYNKDFYEWTNFYIDANNYMTQEQAHKNMERKRRILKNLMSKISKERDIEIVSEFDYD